MYFLYILLCSDNSLYTGITNDLDKRMESHRKGLGSKYVRARLPFKIIYQKQFENRSEALKREAEVKGWKRQEKIARLLLNVE